MRKSTDLSVLDSRLEAWCPLCGGSDRPPALSYCDECRPAWEEFRARLELLPGRRITRRIRALMDLLPQALLPFGAILLATALVIAGLVLALEP